MDIQKIHCLREQSAKHEAAHIIVALQKRWLISASSINPNSVLLKEYSPALKSFVFKGTSGVTLISYPDKVLLCLNNKDVSISLNEPERDDFKNAIEIFLAPQALKCGNHDQGSCALDSDNNNAILLWRTLGSPDADFHTYKNNFISTYCLNIKDNLLWNKIAKSLYDNGDLVMFAINMLKKEVEFEFSAECPNR